MNVYKVKYVIKRYEKLDRDFHYYNTFYTVEEAMEEKDRLQRVYGGLFVVFQERM